MRRRIAEAFAGILMFVVAGCTGAQMEGARMQRVGAETTTSMKACVQNIEENPDYAALKLKTFFGADSQVPLQMVNDRSSPTKAQIGLLYRVYDDAQECRKIALEGASKMHPLVLGVMVNSYAESDKLWASMTAGRLTWGQFNQGRKEIGIEAQQKMVQTAMTINSQLQNQHQFEQVQRQRAAEAMQRWAYQQQQLQNQQALVNAVNQPRMRTINCNYFGNSAQCTSY